MVTHIHSKSMNLGTPRDPSNAPAILFEFDHSNAQYSYLPGREPAELQVAVSRKEMLGNKQREGCTMSLHTKQRNDMSMSAVSAKSASNGRSSNAAVTQFSGQFEHSNSLPVHHARSNHSDSESNHSTRVPHQNHNGATVADTIAVAVAGAYSVNGSTLSSDEPRASVPKPSPQKYTDFLGGDEAARSSHVHEHADHGQTQNQNLAASSGRSVHTHGDNLYRYTYEGGSAYSQRSGVLTTDHSVMSVCSGSLNNTHHSHAHSNAGHISGTHHSNNNNTSNLSHSTNNKILSTGAKNKVFSSMRASDRHHSTSHYTATDRDRIFPAVPAASANFMLTAKVRKISVPDQRGDTVQASQSQRVFTHSQRSHTVEYRGHIHDQSEDGGNVLDVRLSGSSDLRGSREGDVRQRLLEEQLRQQQVFLRVFFCICTSVYAFMRLCVYAFMCLCVYTFTRLCFYVFVRGA
jgi:hypothetical protein